MKTQKKIAMGFGGAVLVACVALGGLGAANAATTDGTGAGSAPSAASIIASKKAATAQAAANAAANDAAIAAKKAAAEKAAAEKAAATQSAGSSANKFTLQYWIATHSLAEQKAALADTQAKAEKYAPLHDTSVDEKLAFSIDLLQKAVDAGK